ncbi:MAG: chemotaxis protein CheC [Francisellaceae bacterium]|jgi:chemotaxis protein CheC
MINLSADEEDALAEVCNVGMSKAAKQLSLLLNSHINIAPPKINILTAQEMIDDKLFQTYRLYSFVRQTISKDIEGNAVLIFKQEQTSLLTQAIIGTTPQLSEQEVRACEQEAMLEVGNIIISSCMSAIVNMLSIEIRMGVPNYHEDKITHLVEGSFSKSQDDIADIILISTELETPGEDISGRLLLMLSVDSIKSLLESVKALLGQ